MSEIISINGNNEGLCIITGRPIRKGTMFESITKITDKETGAMIRVWREQKELPEYVDANVLAVFKCLPGGFTMPEITDVLSSLEGVTAVELTDRDGLGAIVHFDKA